MKREANTSLFVRGYSFPPEGSGDVKYETWTAKRQTNYYSLEWVTIGGRPLDGEVHVIKPYKEEKHKFSENEQTYIQFLFNETVYWILKSDLIEPKSSGNEGSNNYSQEDYDYLVALGTECPTYDGFLAVAYSIINRADERNQSIREVVTAKNQYSGFRDAEIGNPKNEAIKKAAIDALSGAVSNPIGKATFFFGRVNNYDLWYESTKCHYIKEVDGNVFYVSEDYVYVHNMSSTKTSDAVVIYSCSQGQWLKRGLIVN